MLASNTNNIRFNGTGRALMGAVGGAGFHDIGELESFNFNQNVTTEKINSTRHAARATIIEAETAREATLTIGMRELSEENLKLACLADAIIADNQAKSFADQVVPVFADDLFIDLGHVDVTITRITGAITGTLAVGDVLTGDVSGATMKAAYVGAGFVLAVNLSGTITSGEQLEETADTNYILATSVATENDVCITSAAGDELRVQGTDYNLDPQYGYLRKLSGGDIEATDVCSYDYPAKMRNVIHGLSAASVERQVIMMTDKNDRGPRMRITYHKVKLLMNGDMPYIGDGVAAPTLQGTVLFDSSRPAGQEYYKKEIL